MKVRISPIGNLEIFRKYEYKVQTCCYHQFKSCGDHCPLFQEPQEQPCYDPKHIPVTIKLCKREFSIEKKDFQDLRAKQETEYDYKFDSGDDN